MRILKPFHAALHVALVAVSMDLSVVHGFQGHSALPDVPETGVTRYYNFTLSRSTKAPDGYNKSMILVNGQFPGPTIEANLGDTIQVTVHNAIANPEEGTAIHWHGLPQTRTPWYDGVPSSSQCPIAPGESFVYRFPAEVFGTTWWHSHYSGQVMDGAFGPLIIHGPDYYDYDVDLGPIVLSDYTHTEYLSYLLAEYHIPPEFLPIQNNLINGLMPFDCNLDNSSSKNTCNAANARMANFQFEKGKTYLLRLINAGASGSQKFSIDNHELTVVTNDFTLIEPYKTQVVTLGVGQRSDVLVKATGSATDSFWMRSDIDVACLNITSYQPNATAIIHYSKADPARLPTTSRTAAWVSNNCANDPLAQTIPLFRQTPGIPDITQVINLTVSANASGNLVFLYNQSTFYADYSDPLLREVYDGNTSFPTHTDWNVYNYGNATSVRLIIYNSFPTMHTMHLHGFSFWVLAEGMGLWDGTITNPKNPQRRDGQQMGFGTIDEPSYIVIQFDADNPGVWPFHCHLATHSSAGLYANLVIRPDLVPEYGDVVPNIIDQTCMAWDAYTASHNVLQIDSGVKHRRDVSHLVPRQP